jgi:hypothetical protein
METIFQVSEIKTHTSMLLRMDIGYIYTSVT